jgi:hypothetical protein
MGDVLMFELPDTDEFLRRLFEAYGGANKFFEVVEQQLAEFNALWAQDVGAMGRVLRSHLFVEFYITAYLQKANPNLASIDDAKLGLSQKTDLLGDDDSFIKMLVPGIRRLNMVRNRLAHNLSASVTQDDLNSFMSIGIYRAMREESERRSRPFSNDPLDVYEHFAKFVAGTFHHASSDEAKYWRNALAPKQRSIHGTI